LFHRLCRGGAKEAKPKEASVKSPWVDRSEAMTLLTLRDAVGAACGRLARAYIERDWEKIEALCRDLRELWEAIDRGSGIPMRPPVDSLGETPRAGERTRTSSPTLTPLPCS
jgi:hypothetical protein